MTTDGHGPADALARIVLHSGHGTETPAPTFGSDAPILLGGLVVLLVVTGIVWYLTRR